MRRVIAAALVLALTSAACDQRIESIADYDAAYQEKIADSSVKLRELAAEVLREYNLDADPDPGTVLVAMREFYSEADSIIDATVSEVRGLVNSIAPGEDAIRDPVDPHILDRHDELATQYVELDDAVDYAAGRLEELESMSALAVAAAEDEALRDGLGRFDWACQLLVEAMRKADLSPSADYATEPTARRRVATSER